MTRNPFDDKDAKPDGKTLAAALGSTMTSWNAIVNELAERSGLVQEWKFYGKKYGWQLKVATKKAAVIYMIPHEGSFLAALALPPKAVDAVRTSDLPPDVIREIEAAKTYSEGRPARVEVTGKKQLEVVRRLLAIKLESARH
jgi:hypothetical protein